MFNEDKILKRFIDYVKISSESGNEKEFADRLADDLEKLGAEITTDEAGGKAGSNTNNIYAFFKGDETREPLMFSCHMDTVKPGLDIKPLVVDGVVRSEGDTILGSDDKSGISALVEAMERVRDNGKTHGPVQMIFTVGEEVGLRGSKNLDYKRLIGNRCYVIDSSGKVGKIIVQAPAQNKITAEIKGRPAHAGIAPEKGISAIMVGAEAIGKMRLLRVDDETTANIGSFEAVGETNIVSPVARIVGEIRSLDKVKIEKQTAHMEGCLREAADRHGAEVDIDVEKMYEPYCFSDKDSIVAYVMDKCRKMGIDPVTASSGGGSDANVYNAMGIETVNLGCGVNNAHTTDEYIEVAELVNITKLAYNMIIDA